MNVDVRPIKFRVENYKSVRDSGIVWLSHDLTALAGKNESGKSAILEALRDFGSDKKLHEDAWPIHLDGAVPRITLWCRPTESKLNDLQSDACVDLPKMVRETLLRDGFGIYYDANDGYVFADDTQSAVDQVNDRPLPSSKWLRDTLNRLAKLIGGEGWQEAWDGLDEDDLLVVIREWLSGAQAALGSSANKETAAPILADLNERLPVDSEEAAGERFFTACLEALPPIIFFSDLENLLPFEVPISEGKKHEAIIDFASIAGLNLDELAAMDEGQLRRNKLSSCSAKVSGDFRGHYSQDSLALVAEVDGKTLRIGVCADDKPLLFRAEQRSRGFQWFLSFYLRLSASCTEGALILIDEPGLYLHARAQDDILNMLENLCKQYGCTIVFSTHSPYLINSDRLDRVRLVEHSPKTGSVVENKIHRGATTDSLTPVLTKLGLDVVKGLSGVGQKNLLLEGISDYYFISGFKKLVTDVKLEASLIPAVGASKIPQLVSVLIGWGIDFAVLVDNDAEGTRCVKDLTQLDVPADRVVRTPITNAGIEAIFEPGELSQLIEMDGDRSKQMPDKVLAAKKFAELAATQPKKCKLAPATQARVRSLLTELQRAVMNTADRVVEVKPLEKSTSTNSTRTL